MNTLNTGLEKTTMFYDGGCPMCAREVAHYRRIDAHHAVHWLDINAHPESLEKHGVGYTAAMKHLHVMNSNGEILRGAYAFHALWKALPRYRVLAFFVSVPGFL
ncbi:MAG: putative DCC family thiol-disulfide oxidoreductase YuxK, partial [Granulosicoccus sp.]